MQGNDKTEDQPDAGASPQGVHEKAPPPPEEQTASQPSDPGPAPANRTGDDSLDLEDRTVVQPGLAGSGPQQASSPSQTGIPDKTEVVLESDLSGPGTSPPGQPTIPEEKTEAQAPTEVYSAQAPTDRPLAQVTGYEVLHKLGQGTYGEVWLAQEERTGIRVAIKFFAHGTSLQWQLVQAEVKQLARLHADPGIIQLIDVELNAVPPYYVMAYAEGGSLANRLDQGPLPVAVALEIFRQVAEALAYVHAKGVRHCDLKPGNILLNARGRALIGDFGQAHLSSDASPALGTFFYMAPEQADLSTQIPDTRWDVYGLGAIFYAMLTGHPPHEDPQRRNELTATQELSHRLRRYREFVQMAPRPQAHRHLPGMDRRLIEMINRCLEVDPARRLRDAGAVLAALERRERQLRQRPLLVFGLVAQVLLFLVMTTLALWATEAGLHQSEAALTEQLLQSDQVSASLVANALEKHMVARRNLLERLAGRDQVRRAVRDRDAARLKRLVRAFSQEHSVKVLSWVVVDNQGKRLAIQLNSKLPPAVQIPTHFGWRDWFNGEGDQLDDKDGKFSPIRRSHISQPFMSKVRNELIIGISTPVFAPEDKRTIVGVLYTPVLLKEIHEWLDRVRIKDGFAVLVDERGYCLRHREGSRIKAGSDQNPPRWFSPTFQAALREEGSTPAYEDPIDERTYLAGYAPLPRLGWGALVQHERDPALRPIADLKKQMIFIGIFMLLTVMALVSGLWGWLIWTLRRKERLAQG